MNAKTASGKSKASSKAAAKGGSAAEAKSAKGAKAPSGRLPPDPCPGGIAEFARRFRDGSLTAEAATRVYLERIVLLQPGLNAFEAITPEIAIEQARAADALLAAGIDLGPLMGVATSVKDILAVDGAPTTAGSNADVADLIGPEGSFVKTLRRLGCVFVGKSKTPEFAHGSWRWAMNASRGQPRNPWYPDVPHVAGGSSSGAGVSVATGMCLLGIGSDTGASIRNPAAINGVFGLKTTNGLWPLDGVFPLSRSNDTLGIITRTAEDGAIAYAAIMDETPLAVPSLKGLRFGKPTSHFFEHVSPPVGRCLDATFRMLGEHGAEIVPVEVPEGAETAAFAGFVDAEFMASFGRERFLASRHVMDPNVWKSLEPSLAVTGDQYAALRFRRTEIVKSAHARFKGLDAILTPLVPVLAPTCADVDDPVKSIPLKGLGMRNTRFASFCDLAAVSVPIHGLGAPTGVGLQVIAPGFAEPRLLAISRAIQAAVGPSPLPDPAPFLGRA